MAYPPPSLCACLSVGRAQLATTDLALLLDDLAVWTNVFAHRGTTETLTRWRRLVQESGALLEQCLGESTLQVVLRSQGMAVEVTCGDILHHCRGLGLLLEQAAALSEADHGTEAPWVVYSGLSALTEELAGLSQVLEASGRHPQLDAAGV